MKPKCRSIRTITPQRDLINDHYEITIDQASCTSNARKQCRCYIWSNLVVGTGLALSVATVDIPNPAKRQRGFYPSRSETSTQRELLNPSIQYTLQTCMRAVSTPMPDSPATSG